VAPGGGPRHASYPRRPAKTHTIEARQPLVRSMSLPQQHTPTPYSLSITYPPLGVLYTHVRDHVVLHTPSSAQCRAPLRHRTPLQPHRRCSSPSPESSNGPCCHEPPCPAPVRIQKIKGLLDRSTVYCHAELVLHTHAYAPRPSLRTCGRLQVLASGTASKSHPWAGRTSLGCL
jgi:hypothetical protein